jgi:hypothetical protein
VTHPNLHPGEQRGGVELRKVRHAATARRDLAHIGVADRDMGAAAETDEQIPSTDATDPPGCDAIRCKACTLAGDPTAKTDTRARCHVKGEVRAVLRDQGTRDEAREKRDNGRPAVKAH